jgi:photosystem II stability/assembly factor-like uncharacterized protein
MKKLLLSSIYLLSALLLSSPAYAQGTIDSLFEMMQNPDVNFYDVQKYAENYFSTHSTGRGRGYKQYKRWEYDMSYYIDESGNRLNKDALIEAGLNFVGRYKTQVSRGAAAVDKSNWIDLGPVYWKHTSSWAPGLGRIDCIVVDPKNQSLIYAGSPEGGLWKTSNGGATWNVVSENIPTPFMKIASVALDPANSSIVYAGTTGGKIYKSTDGALTWTAATGVSGSIRKIIIHPTTTSVIIAAGASGVFRSSNGGASFTSVSSGNFYDVEFKPGDPNTVYASSTGSNFYKSTNGGTSFSTVALGATGAALIAVTPANPNIIYVKMVSTFLRSTDGGASFKVTIVSDPANGTNFAGYSPDGTDNSGQGTYNMALAASPTDANEVHIGNIITWKSTNGGDSFVATTEWMYPNSRGYTHCDMHALEYYGNTLFTGSDGGIFKSTDKGDNYTNISEGISNKMLYRIGCSAIDANIMGGGAQDNGTCMRTDMGVWIDWLGADGMETIFDHKNKNIAYGTSQNGSLYKTTNQGQTQSSLNGPSGGAWVTPFIMDPIQSTTLYVGTAGVYKSTNSGGAWTKSSSFSTQVTQMNNSPTDANYVYAATGSTLYVTKNAGGTWTAVGSGLSGTITYITVHNSSPSKVAVSTTSGVFTSTDAGATWKNITGTLPGGRATCVVYENGTNEGLYAGSISGVYYIDKNKTDWEPFMNNLPMVDIKEMEIQYKNKVIRAATYGRGFWESPLFGVVSNVNDYTAERNRNLFTYPNPTDGTVNINFELNNAANVQLLIYDNLGRVVATLLNNNINPGKQTYTYDLSKLAPGLYICKLITDDQFEVTSIIKQ